MKIILRRFLFTRNRSSQSENAPCVLHIKYHVAILTSMYDLPSISQACVAQVWIFIGKEKEHILVVLTLTEFLQKS